MKKFTKEELMDTYIVNDHGELREKYVNACISAGYEHQRSNLEHSLLHYDLSFISNNSEWPWARVECIGQTNSQEAISNCTEITLEDFKDTPTTPEINWDEAPEGYDYWVVPKLEGFSSCFHCLKDGYFYDKGRYRWREGNPSIEVYKRPEPDSVPATPEINWDEAPEGYDYWVVSAEEGYPLGFRYLKAGKLYKDDGYYLREDSPNIEVYKRPEPDSVPHYWKDTEVDVESIFDLKEALEGGKLLWGDFKQSVRDEHQLMTLIIDGEEQIYQRVEVKWQDEVEEYLQGCHSGQGMFDIVYNGNQLDLADEDFLEAARIALRGVGEYDEK